MEFIQGLLDASNDLYEQLCALSTLLVIAEDQALPIDQLIHSIEPCVEAGGMSGDIFVMASRVVATLLEQTAKKHARLATRTVERIGALLKEFVAKQQSGLVFDKCSAVDLVEELLRSFTAVKFCVGSWEPVLPLPSLRAMLCVHAIKQQIWICIPQALNILLTSVAPCAEIGLQSTIIDAVSEFVEFGLSVHSLDGVWDSVFQCLTRFVILSSFSSESDLVLFRRLLNLLKRVAAQNPNSRRLCVVMATVATYGERLPLSYVVPAADLRWLCSFLATERVETARRGLFSNPYTVKQEMQEGPKLAGSEWVLETPVRSALALLARVIKVPAKITSEFLWAWQGEGGEWIPYTSSICAKLTKAARSGSSNCIVSSGGQQYDIDLFLHIQRNVVTGTMRPVMFQPLPWIRRCVWEPALLTPPVSISVDDVLRACRPHLEKSELARVIFSAAVLETFGPESESELQGLVTEYFDEIADAESLQHYVSTGVDRDERWAPVFRRMGLGTETQMRKSERLEVGSSFVEHFLRNRKKCSAELLMSLPREAVSGLVREALAVLSNHIAWLPSRGTSSLSQPRYCCSAAVSCPQKHELRVRRFRHWTCSKCGQKGHDPVLSCGKCKYDLCGDCFADDSSACNSLTTPIGLNVAQGCGGAPGAYFTSERALSASSPWGAIPPGAIVHCTGLHSLCCKWCGVQAPVSFSSEPSDVPDVLQNAVTILLFALRTEGEFSHVIEKAVVLFISNHAQSFIFSGLGAAVHVMELCKPLLRLAARREAAIFCSVENVAYFHEVEDTRGSRKRSVSHVVARQTILEDVGRVMRSFSSTAAIDFTFKDEVGTGNGPTQEAYNSVCSTFAGQKSLWFPSAVGFPSKEAAFPAEMFLLGCCFAKAFVDGYTLSLPLHCAMWVVPLPSVDVVSWSWVLLDAVDPDHAKQLRSLRGIPPNDLADLGLYLSDGSDLTAENVNLFLDQQVVQCCSNWRTNLQHFHHGLSRYLELDVLRFFNPNEMESIFCGDSVEQKGLEVADLSAVVVGAHGFTTESDTVQRFIRVVAELSPADKALFLEYLTGLPRLPFGGLGSLGKPITVVRKDFEGPNEQTLPSVNTCFLYIKIPPYSTEAILKERLLTAIREGRANFGLS